MNRKKAQDPVELNDDQVEELKKCLHSPIYFIENYVQIIHPVHGIIPFKMYDHQKEMISNYENDDHNVVLASRQVGTNVATCAYILWYSIFKEYRTTLIIGNKFDDAKSIMHTIQMMYEGLPDWIKPAATDETKRFMSFDNRSRIIAKSTSEHSPLGIDASLVYCRHMAYIAPKLQKQIWDKLTPIFHNGSKVIVTSSPRTDDDTFFEIWKGAGDHTNGFKALHVTWNSIPGRDYAFKERITTAMGEITWRQQYECEFIT